MNDFYTEIIQTKEHKTYLKNKKVFILFDIFSKILYWYAHEFRSKCSSHKTPVWCDSNE